MCITGKTPLEQVILRNDYTGLTYPSATDTATTNIAAVVSAVAAVVIFAVEAIGQCSCEYVMMMMMIMMMMMMIKMNI